MPETQGSQTAPDVLRKIVETKRREVEALLPLEDALRESAARGPTPRDLLGALRRETELSVMAEVKRRSPGAGPIRPELVPGEVAGAYEAAGAAAISVLTDEEYFGGCLDDLREVRGAVSVPVFRKDFIIHPLQLLEARGAGADGVLLIVRILSDEELRALHQEALGLGMTPLVEIHGEDELERALGVGVSLLGVNNRDLNTFTTSLNVTLEMLPAIPPHVTVISESGIRTAEEVDRLGARGVHGVLVGESLLRVPDPGKAAAELVGRPRVERTDV